LLGFCPYNGFQVIDEGRNWPGGVIWGYPGGSANPTVGNKAKPQADLAEFTIGAVGEDYYDLSNVVRPSSFQPDFE
jgi:hypothetical protein